MNEYTKQAEDFLKETKTTLEIVIASPQKRAPFDWNDSQAGDKRINWTCTLSNARRSYTFDFWGSQHDGEIYKAVRDGGKPEFMKTPQDYENDRIMKKAGINPAILRNKEEKAKALEALKPSAYDILACLDVNMGDTFEDFCDNFGYDTDSIRARDTFERVREQEINLRKLFTLEELDKLAEIN